MAENNATNSITKKVEGRELSLERVFAAPRELVFKAFSTPEALSHWWGPTGWTLPVCKVDFRPGGIWHYCMRSPDGTQDSWGKAIYKEIVEPERIVYEDNFSDAEGNLNTDLPSMLITMIFEDVGGNKTKLQSKSTFATTEALEAVLAMGAEEGIKQTWDRLDAYLAS